MVSDPNASFNEIRDSDISSTGKAVVTVDARDALSTVEQLFWGSNNSPKPQTLKGSFRKEPRECRTAGGLQATDHRKVGLPSLLCAYRLSGLNNYLYYLRGSLL